MGQVPKTHHYGLIGHGRLATHLAHYFDLAGVPSTQWARPRPSLSPAETADLALRVLRGCDVLLLAVADRAIAPLAEALRAAFPADASLTMVHFSGALTVAGVESAHPLMSFGPDLYIREEYERIPFITTEGGAAFQDLFPALPNPNFTLGREKKALYHALCVLSGNLGSLLWSKALTDFERKLGLPASVLHPFLRRSAENTLQSPESSLTGPLARGDQATIQANLHALEGDPYQKIYKAFTEALIGDSP